MIKKTYPILEKIKNLLQGCKKRCIAIAVSAAVLILFWALRPCTFFMNTVITYITAPLERTMAWLCSFVPFSMAELLWAAGIAFAVILVVRAVYKIIKYPQKLRTVVHFFVSLVCCGLVIYSGATVLWGINYYGDGFQQKSGLYAQPVSTEDLYNVTSWFAQQLALTANTVPRDTKGSFAATKNDIFDASLQVYQNVEQQYPFLQTQSLKPKEMVFSWVMSLIQFTGFYFPFTGEANINTHAPMCLVPATIAHELAHQRGVAAEQEANFVAVLAATTSEEQTYVYSGYLLGYIHLSNALYKADREKWREVANSLPPAAIQDLNENNAYWAQFETPVATAAETVYTGFLQSYGQTMGMQSYGACVDLLVAYYKAVI
ncbi:MAG: DUF3810 domain-containing protein [Oscillospiraceae bacterium]|nr:DUF3810 domain-containing protein [Oscillospiraceae bacterium]